MIVYLEEGTDAEHGEAIATALGSLEAVEDARYVPPDEAMKHLHASLGQHDELLQGIEAGFLPASVEVGLVAGVRDLVSAHPIIERLEATPGVEEVEFLGNWVDDFTAIIGRVQRGGSYLVLIVALLGVFTVAATMRVSATSRASEQRVLSRMGATGVLSRGPTLIEGALQGLLGGVIALLALWLIYRTGAPILASALSISVEFIFLNGRDLAQLTFFGLSLGIVGGLLTNFALAEQEV